MTRVAIEKNILLWALDRSGHSVDSLQKKFPKIKQWVAGEIKPTFKQLEGFAKATLTPLGFLFLDNPPQEKLPIPHFRTLGDVSKSRPSPELLETIKIVQRRQYWMRDYLIDQGQNELQFVNSAEIDELPTSIAQRIRHTLGIDDGWAAKHSSWEDALKALREAMENVGIFIVLNGVVGNNTHRRLDPNEFRGFVLVDEYAPFVFVNNVDGKAAQMFTLAHELSHVFFGSSAIFDLREMQPADDPIEKACNRVAAEFLVPERELLKFWPNIKNEPEPFQKIARQYKVSVLVAVRRALDLNLINKDAFFEFYNKYKKDARREKPPAKSGFNSNYNHNYRVGKRFATTVFRAAKEGKLLYSEAYRLTGLYGKTFDNYISYLEGGGY
jgi:Zn-dependent peptidase ImmA (M78 family)